MPNFTTLFRSSKTIDEIDHAIHLIDAAMEEHRRASQKHQKSLEALRKELRKVEILEGEITDEASSPSEAGESTDGVRAKTRPSGRPRSPRRPKKPGESS